MILTSYDWESDTWTHNGENPTRRIWREVLGELAEKAKAALPECVGRIDKAVAIVLHGDVEVCPDGTAKVASQSSGTTAYHIANSICDCKDFEKAPGNFCKHRLSVALYRKSAALTKERLEAQAESLRPEPVAPEPTSSVEASGTAIPPQCIVELHGKKFVTFSGLLTLAHERGLVSLKADFLTVTAELALAHAVATFADGRTFEESADATPANVNGTIRPHFPRMALTRAKARALRDALNISVCSVEELDT